jgi:hypothetical protein
LDQLEDDLSQGEDKILEVEKSFSQGRELLLYILSNESEGSDENKGSDEKSEFPSKIEKTYHSLEQEFLSRVGDLDLLLKKINILYYHYLQEKEQLEVEEKRLGSEGDEALTSFSSDVAEILKKSIKPAVRDMRQLKQQCIDHGIYSVDWENQNNYTMQLLKEDDVTLRVLLGDYVRRVKVKITELSLVYKALKKLLAI